MDAGLKRKDTTKGPPLRILSLDGGGVRGYSIFIILQEVMHRTFVEIHGRAPHRNEIPKPADHFDLIVGTGTGGLIALMLGRLRLDIETCKELYVRLTRMVFETDKTILGIPTRPTLFKASRLEDAIKEAVRAHTVASDEGKDAARDTSRDIAPRRNASNASTVSFSARSPAAQMAPRPYFARRGDPNALLYDARERRTKTCVTAIYRGAPRGEEPVMLRSYDSRREPAPEFDCRIWEAGRATCAIGLAFKPIQVGQSVFHDDGSGNFNPSPYALDEAVVNEWPGRDIGVFLSIGTGKRPRGSDQHSGMWYDGFLGEYADARRRLIAKIEGCEAIHERMVREHLPRRGVLVDNYYRLNVEVGVGEFGMNEWNRLADISTSTKRYLGRPAERAMVQGAAAKMAKIHRANVRFAQHQADDALAAASPASLKPPYAPPYAPPPVDELFAVELPGDVPLVFPVPPSSSPNPGPNSSPNPSPNPGANSANNSYSPRQSYDSGLDRLSVPQGTGSPSPRSSSERFHPHQHQHQRPSSSHHSVSHHSVSHQETIAEVPGAPVDGPTHRPGPSPPLVSAPSPAASSAKSKTPRGRSYSTGAHPGDDRLTVNAPTPEQYRHASSSNSASASAGAGLDPRRQQTYNHPPTAVSATFRIDPPPLPPKTPLPELSGARTGTANSASARPVPPVPHHAPTQSTSSAVSALSSLSAGSYTGAPLGGAPYPVDDDEAPPPPVNKARKPEYRRR